MNAFLVAVIAHSRGVLAVRPARIDQNGIGLHVRRRRRVRVGVPAHAVIHGQLIVDPPVVAEPDGIGRPRRIDDVLPPRVRIVFVEPQHERAQAREVPSRRVQRRIGRDQGIQVGRNGGHRVAADGLDVPVARVFDVDVLAADLQIV